MRDHGLITTEAALREFVEAVAENLWIAVDTEFMREKTYYPQLCLIQLATPENIGCVDPLVLKDIGPLVALLHDPRKLKVFHAASQDLEVLYQVTGHVPAPVFDTQIAASLLGHGEQIGYANLVQGVLSHEIDKTQSRTDWSRRPLSSAQLCYARDDVRYLTRLYPLLRQDLEDLGRIDWLGPEMDSLTRPETYRPDPGNAWRRVSGNKRLKPRELAVLRELAAWREAEAQELDRPRRWVLPDDVLVAISRARPADTAALRDLRGFPRTIRDAQADRVLRAVQRGLETPRESWPEVSRSHPLTEAEEALVDVAMALLRDLARSQRIGPEAIGSRRDVVALMRGDSDSALARGWREQVAGAEMRRWLSGETALRCNRAALQILLLEPAAAGHGR
jgi:ribonuclease D